MEKSLFKQQLEEQQAKWKRRELQKDKEELELEQREKETIQSYRLKQSNSMNIAS